MAAKTVIDEACFRRYFDLGSVGMAITSPEKGFIEVNDELCRIWGYERSELLRTSWTAITHPDDLALDLANFERVMAGQLDGYSIDKRFIRKDGRVIYSTIAVKCARRADGSVEYFFALLQDITARKQADEALARSHQDIDRRFRERTAEVLDVNERLTQEIEQRKLASAEAMILKDALAAELAAMTRLHGFSTRLLGGTDLEPLLEEVLNAIMSIQEADFGNVQLYNSNTNTLEIVVQRGFQQEFLDHFSGGDRTGSACSRALERRERVIIEDVQADPQYAPHWGIAASSGYRAVQSTPLFGRSGEPLGMMSTHFRKPHRPSDHQLRLTDLYAVHASEMIERKQNEKALLRYQQELQALTARLIEVQETESKYLARELHDVFSQRLAALGIEIGRLVHTARISVKDVRSRLKDFMGQVGSLAKDIHRISRQLHPAILDDLGLAAALENESIAFSEQHAIATRFEAHNVPQRLREDVSLCLYRVAQECLRNIAKHAEATAVYVVLTGEPGEITLEVRDTGDGFDADNFKARGGLGLVSMEERVRLVNGTLSIWSRPGQGTRVTVSVPLGSA